jgi:hypothetical protein
MLALQQINLARIDQLRLGAIAEGQLIKPTTPRVCDALARF